MEPPQKTLVSLDHWTPPAYLLSVQLEPNRITGSWRFHHETKQSQRLIGKADTKLPVLSSQQSCQQVTIPPIPPTPINQGIQLGSTKSDSRTGLHLEPVLNQKGLQSKDVLQKNNQLSSIKFFLKTLQSESHEYAEVILSMIFYILG